MYYKKNTLTVKVDDTYKGFPYKKIKTFNIINKLYDCIIKTDDNCLLNTRLYKKLML